VSGDVAGFLRPRLATALGVGPDLVTDDLELATLGLSSLEIMEIVYDAEDELGIVFPEEALESVTTVGGLIDAIAAEAQTTAAGGAA
jgi:acyl carrier protein